MLNHTVAGSSDMDTRHELREGRCSNLGVDQWGTVDHKEVHNLHV